MVDHNSLDLTGDGENFASSPATAQKGFAISASRTIGVEVERVYAAWTEDGQRGQWLRDDEFVVTDATPGVSLHGDWGDTHLRVFFMPRGALRACVTVDHEQLPTARRAEQMKKFWQARLGRLAAMLERTHR